MGCKAQQIAPLWNVASEAVRRDAPAGGLVESKSKAFSWGWTALGAEERPEELPANIGFAREGVKLMGIPIGTEGYTAAFFEGELQEASKRLEALVSLEDPQAALLLLRMCVISQWMHFARLLPCLLYTSDAADE